MITFIHNTLLVFVTLLLVNLTGCSTSPSSKSDVLSLSTARYGHAVVNDDKKIYVLAGANKTGFLSDIEIIDPATGNIQILPNKIIPRRYFSAVWDGKHSIYIIGGISRENSKHRFEKRVEVFNTQTNDVSFAKELPLPTRINSAVFLNNNIYVFGGTHPKNKILVPTSLVAMLDIKNNKWERQADMPTAKTTKATVKDGFIYLVGGYDRNASLSVFERFNPETNQWLSLAPLPIKISAHSINVVNNKLYVFGDYHNLTSTYAYDFTNEKWQKLEIGYKASRHNAVTTLGKNTYVLGGNTGTSGPFLDDIQVFKL
jgi:N-acetylneuraminic acid mutarotase